MSAVAALAVATPFAVIAVSELAAGPAPASEHRDFMQAAVVTDLPNELMSALQQGLSQFGINLPPLPTGLSPAGAQPALGMPGLTSPGRSTPGLTSPGLTSPGLTAPGLTAPGLTAPGLTTPGLTTPSVSVPPVTAAPGSLTDPGLTNAALTSPALTSPAAPATGLTIPSTGLNPALTSPTGLTPGALPAPGEVPISAPIGVDPLGAGTYPILGAPALGATPASGGGGGIVSDITSAASQLGVGQAIDLLKGVVLPMITSAGAGAAPAIA